MRLLFTSFNFILSDIRQFAPAPRSINALIVFILLLTSCQEDAEVTPMPPEIFSISPSSGKVGDQVIIEGNNFSSDPTKNEVRLNGIECTLTSATNQQLKITVPSGATSGKIGIKVNGLFINSSDDFVVFKDIPRQGLVAYFPFNGNANDESGNALQGIPNGPTLSADRFGKENKAYAFDGIDDFIFVGNAPVLHINHAITISAWIKIQGSPFSVYLLSKIGLNANNNYEGYNLVTYKDAFINQYSHGLVLSGTTNGLIYPEGSWLSDEWNFITLSLEGDHCKLYTNGVKILDKGGAKSLDDIDSSIGNLVIGKSAVAGLENPFQGSIDELTIYNRALTDAEVQDLHDTTKAH